MGPFYCPNDRKVYLDTTFFDDMLEGQLGAEGGPFAIGYVIAHEYGHHVEDQLGVLGKIRTQRGPEERCRARRADGRLPGRRLGQGRPGDQGRPGRARSSSELNQDDIERAIDAAQAVGDDRIQKRTSGRVDTDSFTHGSAEQRVRWFNQGHAAGHHQGLRHLRTDNL